MMAINPDESIASPQMTLEHLLTETRQYLAPQDMERIQRAYDLANRAHMGVARRSGEPFIQHPLEVALLLADMRIDADSIVAALLHDVVEDTRYTLDDLREQFGNAVANIVDGVTKFDALAGKPVPQVGARELKSAPPAALMEGTQELVGTPQAALRGPTTQEQIEQGQRL